MSFIGSLFSANSQASALNSQAKIKRSQGDAAYNRAQVQAHRVRETSAKNLLIAAEQMAAERSNQRKAEGSARAQAATSGFTSQGTGDAVADSMRQAYDEQIANVAQSASIESMNAEQSAIDTVRQGELERMAAYGEADQLRRQSKSIRKGMWWSGAGAVGGLVGGALSAGYDSSTGSMDWGNVFSYDGLKSMYNGVNAGSGFTSSVNPYMAKYAPSDWTDSMMSFFNKK